MRTSWLPYTFSTPHKGLIYWAYSYISIFSSFEVSSNHNNDVLLRFWKKGNCFDLSDEPSRNSNERPRKTTKYVSQGGKYLCRDSIQRFPRYESWIFRPYQALCEEFDETMNIRVENTERLERWLNVKIDKFGAHREVPFEWHLPEMPHTPNFCNCCQQFTSSCDWG
jgi:hypothetical protein